MGCIREPDGVTFYVEKRERTEEDIMETSEFIRKNKLENAELYKSLDLELRNKGIIN